MAHSLLLVNPGVLLFGLLIYISTLSAQNLLPNPGFEDIPCCTNQAPWHFGPLGSDTVWMCTTPACWGPGGSAHSGVQMVAFKEQAEGVFRDYINCVTTLVGATYRLTYWVISDGSADATYNEIRSSRRASCQWSSSVCPSSDTRLSLATYSDSWGSGMAACPDPQLSATTAWYQVNITVVATSNVTCVGVCASGPGATFVGFDDFSFVLIAPPTTAPPTTIAPPATASPTTAPPPTSPPTIVAMTSTEVTDAAATSYATVVATSIGATATTSAMASLSTATTNGASTISFSSVISSGAPPTAVPGSQIEINGPIKIEGDWILPQVVTFVGGNSSVTVDGSAIITGTAVIQITGSQPSDQLDTHRRVLVTASGGIIGEFSEIKSEGQSRAGKCIAYTPVGQRTEDTTLSVLMVPRIVPCDVPPAHSWVIVGTIVGVFGTIAIGIGVLFLYRDTCQQWARGDRARLLEAVIDLS